MLFVVIAAGCGGGDSDEASSDVGASEVDGSSGQTADTSGDSGAGSSVESEETKQAEGDVDPASDQDVAGAQRAIVTIGDEEFSSDQVVVCISLGGSVGGTFKSEAGDVEISIDVPPEDWETSSDGWQAPSVRVRDERDPQNERGWEAGGETVSAFTGVPEGGSQVDSFSVDGSSASGTATFIDLNAVLIATAGGTDPPQPVTGTFEISCG